MSENHTPPTQAELDGWRDKILLSSAVNRLIAEVERLQVVVKASISPHYAVTLERDNARLTKEVEELRKDKERLQAILAVTETIAELSCKAVRDSADEGDFNEDAGKV